MSKKILSPILDITGYPLKKIMWYTTGVLHIALIPIFLGVWSTVPSYVQIFSNWIHLIVGLYLLIRFRPYQTEVEFHPYDRALVFSAGLFMLEALLASTLLNSPWGKEITVYLHTWGDWVKTLPFVAPFLSNSGTSSSSDKEIDNSVAPNLSTSSLGGASYTFL